MRSNSGDPLYRRVLERYIAIASAEAGVTQAVFPEGGLSRDGRLRRRSSGSSTTWHAVLRPSGERDIVFVPVGINYDRIFEDRSCPSRTRPPPTAAAGHRTRPSRDVVLPHFAICWLMRPEQWHRFGYACVNFG